MTNETEKPLHPLIKQDIVIGLMSPEHHSMIPVVEWEKLGAGAQQLYDEYWSNVLGNGPLQSATLLSQRFIALTNYSPEDIRDALAQEQALLAAQR